MYNHLRRGNSRLIGPNCPGILSPGKANVGIIPAQFFKEGNVGLVSRSGTLTYQIGNELAQGGFGNSSIVGIGGDPVPGSSFIDIIELFEADPETELIVMCGEIGGSAEEEAAEYIAASVSKPVVAYIAGFTAPPGKTMGHAGAIVSGSQGTAAAKAEALEAKGCAWGATRRRSRRSRSRSWARGSSFGPAGRPPRGAVALHQPRISKDGTQDEHPPARDEMRQVVRQALDVFARLLLEAVHFEDLGHQHVIGLTDGLSGHVRRPRKPPLRDRVQRPADDVAILRHQTLKVLGQLRRTQLKPHEKGRRRAHSRSVGQPGVKVKGPIRRRSRLPPAPAFIARRTLSRPPETC